MPRKSKKWHFDFIILISAIFAVYGIVQLFLVTHEDCYAVVFAWLSFAIVWTVIAMIRYNQIKGRI
jgi:hypothetical protein